MMQSKIPTKSDAQIAFKDLDKISGYLDVSGRSDYSKISAFKSDSNAIAGTENGPRKISESKYLHTSGPLSTGGAAVQIFRAGPAVCAVHSDTQPPRRTRQVRGSVRRGSLSTCVLYARVYSTTEQSLKWRELQKTRLRMFCKYVSWGAHGCPERTRICPSLSPNIEISQNASKSQRCLFTIAFLSLCFDMPISLAGLLPDDGLGLAPSRLNFVIMTLRYCNSSFSSENRLDSLEYQTIRSSWSNHARSLATFSAISSNFSQGGIFKKMSTLIFRGFSQHRVES